LLILLTGRCTNFKLVLAHAESDWTMPYHETEALFQSTLRAAKDSGHDDNDDDENNNTKDLQCVDLGEAGRQEIWQSKSRTISKTIAKHGGT
jgi:hypothetical protein